MDQQQDKVANKYIDCIKLLLDKNPDLDILNDYGETALMIAVKMNNIQIVRLFIKKGCNINIKNYYGDTALMIAITNSYASIVKLLLNR